MYPGLIPPHGNVNKASGYSDNLRSAGPRQSQPGESDALRTALNLGAGRESLTRRARNWRVSGGEKRRETRLMYLYEKRWRPC